MWSLLWPRRPRDKFSLENLRYLYEELITHDVVDESNKDAVVEILRSIAELMIWGDQHNDHVFYFFCEKNILGHFLRILSLPLDRQITVQILQTLSIMIQNFNRQTSVFYLLSNNHINALILHQFDFGDEEVIAYYISFLKTLSLKLNRDTLQFFFNRDEGTFPLYSQAIQFFHHSEAMVRIAVRTVTLNVYKVDDSDLRKFIVDVSAVPYFSNLVWFIRNQISEVDSMLRQNLTESSKHKLTRLLDVQIDQFHYIMDILRLDIETLNRVLVQQLLTNFIVPVLLEALLKPTSTTLSPRLALFVLFQVFHIFTDNALVNVTLMCLLQPLPSDGRPSGMDASPTLGRSLYDDIAAVKERNADVFSNPARPILLEYLSHSEISQFAAALLLSILRNPEIDHDLLISINFCPQKTIKKRRLLSSLLSSEPTTLSRSPEPISRMRQLSVALESQDSESTYAEDVVDACFKLLTVKPNQEAMILVGYLLTELVHVERGGLNNRHSEVLHNIFIDATSRLRQNPQYQQLVQENPDGLGKILLSAEPSTMLSLSGMSEPSAVLPNDSSTDSPLLLDLQLVATLHRLLTTLTSLSVKSPFEVPLGTPS